jgi:hypothetical protein
MAVRTGTAAGASVPGKPGNFCGPLWRDPQMPVTMAGNAMLRAPSASAILKAALVARGEDLSLAETAAFPRRRPGQAWPHATSPTPGGSLDQISDAAFARYRLTPSDAAAIRDKFTVRPHTIRARRKHGRQPRNPRKASRRPPCRIRLVTRAGR